MFNIILKNSIFPLNIFPIVLPAYYFAVSSLDGQGTVYSFKTCTLQQFHLVDKQQFPFTLCKNSLSVLNILCASLSVTLLSLMLHYIGADDL